MIEPMMPKNVRLEEKGGVEIACVLDYAGIVRDDDGHDSHVWDVCPERMPRKEFRLLCDVLPAETTIRLCVIPPDGQ